MKELNRMLELAGVKPLIEGLIESDGDNQAEVMNRFDDLIVKIGGGQREKHYKGLMDAANEAWLRAYENDGDVENAIEYMEEIIEDMEEELGISESILEGVKDTKIGFKIGVTQDEDGQNIHGMVRSDKFEKAIQGPLVSAIKKALKECGYKGSVKDIEIKDITTK